MSTHLVPGPAPSVRSNVLLMALTLTLSLAPGVPARAHGLDLSGFSPAFAAPAEKVALFGSGFAADPFEHFAFVLGPPGQGVLLEPVATLPGALEVRVGPAATTVDGPVYLWRGRRHLLPGALIGGELGAWKVHQAELFVPTDTAATVKTFRVDATNPLTSSAALAVAGIVVDVEHDGVPPDPKWIDLGVTIDGGSCGSIAPGGGTPLQKDSLQKDPALPCRAFRLRVENIDPVANAGRGALARDLALILQSTFGPVGLVATAEGPWVRISWSRVNTAQNGFGVLRFGR